ncbi:hypothetical protein ACJMK2_010127 [Sinanodonta woodiana]|uniref:Uncharacterized protein n=1 Tax=Sinanodonta woodiana TaxID=1069815 RepID=A0ABD3VHE5_SINWO
MAEITVDDNHTESVDQTCKDVLLQSQYGMSDETEEPTQVSYHKSQVHMETQTDSCISLIEECSPQLERFSVSTQTSYNLVANCDMPSPKTSTFGVQVAPECKSSTVQCSHKHKTRTQQIISLSSNLDVKDVDNLEEADSGDDPSWTPDVSEDHNVEYTADPHKILKYIV